jgi:hypothetical protein
MMQTLIALNEYANTESAIVAVIMLLVLFVYIYELFRLLSGHLSPIKFERFDEDDIYRCLIGVAGLLCFEGAGAAITRVTVWYWRRIGIGGGGGPMNSTQVTLMIIGAFFLIIGRVGVTYFLTQRALGNWPWMLSVAAVVVSTAWYWG